MSRLNELSTLSAEHQRIELATLLAAGLIRLLLQRVSQPTDDDKDSEDLSADGLEDS